MEALLFANSLIRELIELDERARALTSRPVPGGQEVMVGVEHGKYFVTVQGVMKRGRSVDQGWYLENRQIQATKMVAARRSRRLDRQW